MKISLNFLNDFVDLSGVTTEALAEIVTERIAEVEHVTTTGVRIPGVVVGRIESIAPVPGADKIRLTQVSTGDATHQIICGAANIAEGALVPVALPGAILPGDFRIEKRKLKSVESCGMICSESELGLAEKSQGIWLLPTEYGDRLGQELSTLYPGDTIFEIDNNAISHRPDLFGHLGFARELATALGRELRDHLTNLSLDTQTADLVQIDVAQLCARYVGTRIVGLRVTDSPAPWRERLTACGIRPINNLVDVTNLVLLELGQPLHAFDQSKLAGDQVIVRLAAAGEVIRTLDGATRELTSTMLVIADTERPVAIAGVIGGADSEVDADTQTILLEAANFDAVSVRRTSIALGLRTEASLRFEKRLDPTLPLRATIRAIELLRESCPDLRVEASADRQNFDSTPRVIELTLAQISAQLGTTPTSEQIEQILLALGFRLAGSADSAWQVTVPSFRAGRDIVGAHDLVEEIARHIGYNTLPSAFPRLELVPPARSTERTLRHSLSDTLVGFGFHEVCTLALVSQADLQKCQYDPAASPTIANPPNADFKYLRPTLLPSLLAACAHNLKEAKSFRLFEISKSFSKSDDQVAEHTELLAVIAGEQHSFPKACGIATGLFVDSKISIQLQPVESVSEQHPGRVAGVFVDGQRFGTVAELHPAVAAAWGLPAVAFVSLDFERLAALPLATVSARPLPRFPAVPRDAAFVVPAQTLAVSLQVAIQSADSRIGNIHLFDEYTDAALQTKGQKSLAFSFTIQDPDKTLSDTESEAIFSGVLKAVAKIGGQLR